MDNKKLFRSIKTKAVSKSMVKRLVESGKQIKAGKGVKVTLEEIWKY